jgi:hypothetical protein
MAEFCDRCGGDIDPDDHDAWIVLHDWALCAECRMEDVHQLWEALEEEHHVAHR